MTWKTAIEPILEKKRWRQATLAKEAGISKAYISLLLSDDDKKRIKNPTFETMKKIANALGVKVWVLVKEAAKDE